MTTTRRIAATASEWLREGRRVVAALLVGIVGSAPLEPGALMLIAEDGAIEGSITGGCVEAAVVGEAKAIFAGADPHTVTYGISDELAGSVGLTCGGTVHVFVQELSGDEAQVEAEARDAVAAGRPVAIATLLDGDGAGRKLAVIDGEATPRPTPVQPPIGRNSADPRSNSTLIGVQRSPLPGGKSTEQAVTITATSLNAPKVTPSPGPETVSTIGIAPLASGGEF